jgi:hypothetical protein
MVPMSETAGEASVPSTARSAPATSPLANSSRNFRLQQLRQMGASHPPTGTIICCRACTSTCDCAEHRYLLLPAARRGGRPA